MDWTQVAQDRSRWRAIVNMTMNLPVSLRREKFLDLLSDTQLSNINPFQRTCSPSRLWLLHYTMPAFRVTELVFLFCAVCLYASSPSVSLLAA